MDSWTPDLKGLRYVVLLQTQKYYFVSAEVTLKTKMWDEMNADWIKAKAEKEERERQEEKEAAKEVS